MFDFMFRRAIGNDILKESTTSPNNIGVGEGSNKNNEESTISHNNIGVGEESTTFYNNIDVIEKDNLKLYFENTDIINTEDILNLIKFYNKLFKNIRNIKYTKIGDHNIDKNLCKI